MHTTAPLRTIPQNAAVCKGFLGWHLRTTPQARAPNHGANGLQIGQTPDGTAPGNYFGAPVTGHRRRLAYAPHATQNCFEEKPDHGQKCGPHERHRNARIANSLRRKLSFCVRRQKRRLVRAKIASGCPRLHDQWVGGTQLLLEHAREPDGRQAGLACGLDCVVGKHGQCHLGQFLVAQFTQRLLGAFVVGGCR